MSFHEVQPEESEFFYKVPTEETKAEAKKWAEARIVVPGYGSDDIYNKYSCRIITPNGFGVRGWMWMDGYDLGFGIIMVPCNLRQVDESELSVFEKAEREMATDNMAILDLGYPTAEGARQRLGLTDTKDFRWVPSGRNISYLEIHRGRSEFYLPEGEEWRRQSGGLRKQEMLLSVVGLVETFKQNFPELKLEPMAVELK